MGGSSSATLLTCVLCVTLSVQFALAGPGEEMDPFAGSVVRETIHGDECVLPFYYKEEIYYDCALAPLPEDPTTRKEICAIDNDEQGWFEGQERFDFCLPKLSNNDTDVLEMDDINPNGACKTAAILLCTNEAAHPGNRTLLNCLNEHVNSPSPIPLASNACIEELTNFKEIEAEEDNDDDKAIMEACKEDIDMLCPMAANDVIVSLIFNFNNTDYYRFKCFREKLDTLGEDELTAACKAKLDNHEEEIADDYDEDVGLQAVCDSDAEKFCKGVSHRDGLIEDCLNAKYGVLTPECQVELFHQAIEMSDSYNLQGTLVRTCEKERLAFCPDEVAGESRVISCLMNHRSEEDFGPPCKTSIEEHYASRAQDIRLDPELMRSCKNDISILCAAEMQSLGPYKSTEGLVQQCLLLQLEKIKDVSCKSALHVTGTIRSQGLQYSPQLLSSCKAEIGTRCNHDPNRPELIRCLQAERHSLSAVCLSVLVEEEIIIANDVDFMFSVQSQCKSDIDSLCKFVKKGRGRVVQCLSEQLSTGRLTPSCQTEMRRQAIITSNDYRTNYAMKTSCSRDIDEFCDGVEQTVPVQSVGVRPYYGKVQRCLRDNRYRLRGEDCQNELVHFTWRTAVDYRADAVLAAHCDHDVNYRCGKIEKSNGVAIHTCLRQNYSKLTVDCKAEQSAFADAQLDDLDEDPMVQVYCSSELNSLCADRKNNIPNLNEEDMWQCLLYAQTQGKTSPTCTTFVNTMKMLVPEDSTLSPSEISKHIINPGIPIDPKTGLPKKKKGFLHGVIGIFVLIVLIGAVSALAFVIIKNRGHIVMPWERKNYEGYAEMTATDMDETI